LQTGTYALSEAFLYLQTLDIIAGPQQKHRHTATDDSVPVCRRTMLCGRHALYTDHRMSVPRKKREKNIRKRG